jgi:hypothetical protein
MYGPISISDPNILSSSAHLISYLLSLNCSLQLFRTGRYAIHEGVKITKYTHRSVQANLQNPNPRCPPFTSEEVHTTDNYSAAAAEDS